MKSLSTKTFQCGITVQGLTTLAGITYLTGITNTASWDHVIVGTTAQGQIYTRTYAQFMTDVATGIGLSGYVPTSRTLSINGTTYDLSANRSWTISTVDYTSRLQHQVKAGVAINKGQAVYVTSADGTNMIVGLASNASEATSSKTMGLLDATVTTNGFANVVTEGLLAGLDTSGANAAGDPVWLGTGGNLIYGLANKPYAPAHLVFIGIVTRKNSNNGEIFVKVQNGFELNEIHDVDLKTNLPTAGQLLRYDSDGLWKNWSPNYLTAESDTLGTVTSRGSSSAVDIQVNGINVGRGPGALPGYNHNISLGVNNYSPSMTQSRAHIAIGYNSFANLNGGYYSMAIGGYALDAALQPDETIAIGLDALGSATYPGHSVAIGNQSLFADTEGYGNVAVGSRAGSYYNSALGGYGDNTFIGNYAASQLKNSRETTVLGAGALQSTTSNTNQSRGNIALGAGAGYSWNSGYYNTWIGYFTNGFLNGSYNVIIGGNLSTTAIDGAGSMSNSVLIADGAGNIKLFANSSGNVGIGTAAPAYKLQVASGDIAIDYNRYLRGGSGGDWNLVNLYNGGTGDMEITMLNTNWYLRHNANASFAGNVGIGTNSPAYKLDVIGNARIGQNSNSSTAASLQITSGGNGYDAFVDFGYWDSFDAGIWHVGRKGSTGAFFISDYSSGPELNRLTITTGGNVGIGVTSPSTKLDVNGVITATGGNSTNWNTAYSWGNHSSAGYVPQARTLTINGTTYDLSANRSWTIATTTPGGSNTQFQYNSSGTLAGASALTYDSGTNRVGINQASPGYDLDVNGQVRVQDKLRVGNVNSGNGVVHMSSTATINPSATTIVWSQNVSVGMCAFIEYYILNNNTTTDQRAGTIMVTWNQSGTPTIAHTETTTPDIGSTTAVTFTSSLVGSDARINAVNSSSAPYTIVMSYKYF
jgi:hypothetical protein